MGAGLRVVVEYEFSPMIEVDPAEAQRMVKEALALLQSKVDESKPGTYFVITSNRIEVASLEEAAEVAAVLESYGFRVRTWLSDNAPVKRRESKAEVLVSEAIELLRRGDVEGAANKLLSALKEATAADLMRSRFSETCSKPSGLVKALQYYRVKGVIPSELLEACTGKP